MNIAGRILASELLREILSPLIVMTPIGLVLLVEMGSSA